MEADLNFAYSESLIELGIPVKNIDTNTNLTKNRFLKGDIHVRHNHASPQCGAAKLGIILIFAAPHCGSL